MSKNYILEPTEVLFLNDHGTVVGNGIEFNDKMYQISTGTIFTINDSEFIYAHTFEEEGSLESVFTPDGTFDMEAVPDRAVDFIINDTVEPVRTYCTLMGFEAGTYTVSIYTEEDDSEPTSNPFSKNIVHNDHPYNAVERLRAKLKQKVDEGEEEKSGEEESGGDEGGGTASGGGLMKLTFTEDPDNPGTYVCDHTWQEIHDALNNGDIVHGPINVDAIVSEGIENLTTSIIITSTCISYGQYTLGGRIGNDTFTWAGESADEYPTTSLD